MQKMRLIVAVLIMSMIVSVAGVFAQDQNIVEIAAGNEDFSTLVSLVEAAGLVETLSGEGPFTVFAPTNEAFAALPADLVDYLTSEAGADALAAVLTYHVVPGTVMAQDAMDLMSGEVETVNGDSITVEADDMGVFVDGVEVVMPDLVASNGVIHVIDGVILPTIALPSVDPLDFVDGEIVAAGSSTVFPLAERMAESWENSGGVAPTINSIGSGAGFERFCVNGETDISNASRAIRESEVESCAEIGRTPIEFRVGTDALAVTVSAENDFITDVKLEELATIFSTAETWADVRAEWPAEPIQRFIPGTDSGTFDYFVEEIFDEDTAPILEANNLQQSEDDNVLVQGIQGSPYAIGFFGFAYYQENQDTLTVLSLGSVEPNGVTAEDGTYPLARPLFMYSDEAIMEEKPQVAAFLQYVLNTVNDEIIEVGYFPASKRALNLARAQWLAAVAD